MANDPKPGPAAVAVATQEKKSATVEVLERLDDPSQTMVPIDASQGAEMRVPGEVLAVAGAFDPTIAELNVPIQLDEAQTSALSASLAPTELEIKPDRTAGVYIPHTTCRARLNKAFGLMRWRQVPTSRLMYDAKAKVLYRVFRLDVVIGNRWHEGPTAMGEQPWLGDSNSNFTWGDAIEGCASIGLSRLCKSIGMVVDRRTAEEFKLTQCVRVFVEKRPDKGSDQPGAISTAWRRKDAAPLEGETGLCNDSPNAAGYKQPPAPWWRRKKGDAPAQTTSGRTPSNATKITKKQSADLWKEVDKAQLSDDDVATTIRDRFGFHKTSDITVDQYPLIIDWIRKGGD